MFGNSYGRDERENSSPISEGEEYDVKIEDLGRDGDGIT
ncbi:MAG: deoxyribonuclease, partial [Methanobacteriales archaeon HGW-Methanobacteriales-2]